MELRRLREPKVAAMAFAVLLSMVPLLPKVRRIKYGQALRDMLH